MVTEYQAAIEELKKAYNNFDNAAPEYIDVALLQIDAAKTKVDNILREMKREAREN